MRAVPGDRLVSLDYYCENTEVWRMTDCYYGKALYLVLFGKLRRQYDAQRQPSRNGTPYRAGFLPQEVTTSAEWVRRSKRWMSIR